MPPIRTGERILFPDECPIPNCSSGRLRSITRAGQHFATKRHRDLALKLKKCGDSQYHEVFLSWARNMNYISLLNELPSRSPLQPLSPNRSATRKRNSLLSGKSLSSPQLKPPVTKKFQTSMSANAALSRTKSMGVAEETRITWLPPVVVNPVRASPISSSSIPLAEKQVPPVIRWATSTTHSTVFESQLQPSPESHYFYDFEKSPATILRETTYFWNDGVPTTIPPPALVPPSLIPPIDQDPLAPGYMIAPSVSNSQSFLPPSHSQQSSSCALHSTQNNDPSSDATVLEEDCEEIEQCLPPASIESKIIVADLPHMTSPVYSESTEAAILSPSTIPDDHSMDSEHEPQFLNALLGEPVLLNHGPLAAEQTLHSPSVTDISLYFHPSPHSSQSHADWYAPVGSSSGSCRTPYNCQLMAFASPPSGQVGSFQSPHSTTPIIHHRKEHTMAVVLDRRGDTCEGNDNGGHGYSESRREN
ncbi:hypothetical protein V1517DRAFT_324155 [Lipomyces orientalis]|uniref:Uncharacterized protein n=1 Tax=Lipomyces orientalis TaxID=1233043 RepID=A0ACC3TN00_9ASCO